jgi:ABC-2 type transport system permease protein
MLKIIIKHEWRLLLADRTAWLVVALFAGLIGYAVLNGTAWTQRQQAGISRYLAESEAQLKSYQQETAEIEAGIARGEAKETKVPTGARHPYQVSTFAGLSASLPPAPLAPLVVGESDLYPAAYRVGQQAETEEQIENPLKLLVGRFDLAYVMLFFYPLLICALSFNLLAAEKESGTLGLLLAQPLRLRALVAGKVVVRALLVFGAVITFSLLGVWFSGVQLTSGDVWLRLLVWLVGVLGYGLFWFSLALIVNALGRSAPANALTLAACWLLLVVIIPSLISLLASTLYPMPSRAELINARRIATEEVKQIPADEARTRFFNNYPEIPRDGAYTETGQARILFAARAEEIKRRVDEVERRFDDRLRQQQNLVSKLRVLSPAILLQEVLLAAGGSNRARHRHFLAQKDEYAQQWNSFFNPRIFAETALNAADFARIPRFTYHKEPWRNNTARFTTPLLGLLALALICSLIGLMSLRRFSPVG